MLASESDGDGVAGDVDKRPFRLQVPGPVWAGHGDGRAGADAREGTGRGTWAVVEVRVRGVQQWGAGGSVRQAL